jgi:hypothetical protein
VSESSKSPGDVARAARTAQLAKNGTASQGAQRRTAGF